LSLRVKDSEKTEVNFDQVGLDDGMSEMTAPAIYQFKVVRAFAQI
jgi:hypothetical protein